MEYALLAPPKNRGEINHNPFDLEDFGIDWDGLADPRHDAENFCRFLTDFDGLRAGMKDLHTAWVEGANTTRKLVTKFAPPSENDTAAYTAAVSKEVGISPDAVPALDVPEVLAHYGKAFIHQEQGRVIYPDDLLLAGAMAALGISRGATS